MKRLEKQNLKALIRNELKLYREAFAGKQYDQAFKHLERIHIVSQPFPVQHTWIHLRMLRFAFVTFRPVEILVQLVYALFSGKFSMLCIFPAGNTGGADALLKGRMKIPEDLEKEMNN